MFIQVTYILIKENFEQAIRIINRNDFLTDIDFIQAYYSAKTAERNGLVHQAHETSLWQAQRKGLYYNKGFGWYPDMRHNQRKTGK